MKKTYKYFIGYLYNNHKVMPLHIMLPKKSAYVKSYDGENKWMYFWIEDDNVIEKNKLMFLEKIIFENAFFEGAILKMYSRCLSSQ